MINKQIYITSVAKSVSKAKIYGKLNNRVIQLFKLYKDSIDFVENSVANGSTQFEDYVVYLKNEASKLIYKYPKELCNYKVIVPNDISKLITETLNTAPTVSNNSVNINTEETYQFKVSDFTLDYNDLNYDDYKYLLIYPLGSSLYGSLKTTFNTVNINSPIVIDIEGLSSSSNIDLYYNRTDFTAFGPDVFNFRVSDNNINYLYSNIKTFSVSGEVSSANNLPPTIGDITLYAANRVTTILTLSMFTDQLTPPYNDPENDLIDAIRIVDISDANQGVYLLNGAPVNAGQIITREEIQASLFVHSGPNINDVSSDVFEFQARDEGSKIWVD